MVSRMHNFSLFFVYLPKIKTSFYKIKGHFWRIEKQSDLVSYGRQEEIR